MSRYEDAEASEGPLELADSPALKVHTGREAVKMQRKDCHNMHTLAALMALSKATSRHEDTKGAKREVVEAAEGSMQSALGNFA